jgi:hypothetical protein
VRTHSAAVAQDVGTGKECGLTLRHAESTGHVSPACHWLQGGLGHGIPRARERVADRASRTLRKGVREQGCLIVPPLTPSGRGGWDRHADACLGLHLFRQASGCHALGQGSGHNAPAVVLERVHQSVRGRLVEASGTGEPQSRRPGAAIRAGMAFLSAGAQQGRPAARTQRWRGGRKE